ncbi:MAG: hypothetical protein V8T65_10015 [Roseburia inulinivorans]
MQADIQRTTCDVGFMPHPAWIIARIRATKLQAYPPIFKLCRLKRLRSM